MTERVKNYLYAMRNAAYMHLSDPNSIYSGIEGHRRFFRESGYALNDFSQPEQNDILKAFYSTVYVIGCKLKPLLDAEEMYKIMREQIK